jgi:hypothetical protein
MKKILIISVLLAIQIASSGQMIPRYVDSKIEFINPSPQTEIQSPLKLKVSFLLTNQGPDTLYPDDIIEWNLLYNLQEERLPLVKRTIDRYLLPGDNMVLYDSFYINSDINTNRMSLTFSVPPSCHGLQKSKRPLRFESYEDKIEDNDPTVYLIHRAPSLASITPPSNHLTIYPNPLLDGNLQLKGEWSKNINFIEVIDFLGKIKEVPVLKQSTNEVMVDLSDFNAGLYFIRIRVGEKTYRKTVVIQ